MFEPGVGGFAEVGQFELRELGARGAEVLEMGQRVVTQAGESDDGEFGQVLEIEDGYHPGVLDVSGLKVERFQGSDLSDMLNKGGVVGIFRLLATVVRPSTLDTGCH